MCKLVIALTLLIMGTVGTVGHAKADPAFFAAAAANIPGSVAFAPLSFFIIWAVTDDIINRNGLSRHAKEVQPGAGYVVKAADVSNGLVPVFTATVSDPAAERRAQLIAEYQQAIGGQVAVASIK